MNVTFNELRSIKDQLPHGGLQKIAKELNLSIETVRHYFGSTNNDVNTEVSGINFEPGPGGGIVHLEDTRIYEAALQLIQEVGGELAR